MLLAMRRASSKHVGNLRVTECLSRIDVGEGLLVSVHDFEATWNLFNGPWWREASHWRFRGGDASQKGRGGKISDLTPFDTSGANHQLNIAASVIC